MSIMSPSKDYEAILNELEDIKVPDCGVVTSRGREKTIEVNTQADFDRIQEKIVSAQQEGYKTIIVSLSSGPFYYRTQHILLRKQDKTDTVLKINGNRTRIVSKGNLYDSYAFDNSRVYFSSSMESQDVWSTFYGVEGSVEVVNENTKECRVYNSLFRESNWSFSEKSLIQITQWFNCPVYSVTGIKDGFIYFIADDLERILNTREYSVNYDLYVSKKSPVFRLCNVREKGSNKQTPVYECSESLFLYLDQCQYHQIELSGISFYGNCYGRAFIKLMSSSSTLIDIHDCAFHNMKSTCIYAYNTDNLVLRNNGFFDIYNNAVYCFDHGKAPIIKDNTFMNVGLSCKNTFAITCRGDEGYVINNKIVNFGYGAISIGHNQGEINDNRMIVQGNNIYNTPDNSGSPLIDGGAIYLYPNSVNCLIRYNRVDSIFGRGSNRGIYCDNGAYGFSLYGNIVTRVNNSYCIDSWLDRRDARNNTRNLVMLNIVDGRCRFEGSETNNNQCLKGPNFVITKETSIVDQAVGHYLIIGQDISLSVENNMQEKVKMSSRDKRILKRFMIFNGLKRFIV